MKDTYFKITRIDGNVCLSFHKNEKVWSLIMTSHRANEGGKHILDWIDSNDNSNPEIVLLDGSLIRLKRTSSIFMITLPIGEESDPKMSETEISGTEFPIKQTIESKRVSSEPEIEISKSELEKLANTLLQTQDENS